MFSFFFERNGAKAQGRKEFEQRISSLRLCAFVSLRLMFFLGVLTMAANAAEPVGYTLTPGVPNSHLIEVTVDYAPDAKDNKTVDFAIPAWRPGRYLIQNYARNIQEFAAFDEAGGRLDSEKIDKNTWRVTRGKAKRISVKYKYYANVLDAGSTLLNEDELYWNGTNLLMYVVGRKDLPARISIKVPADWKYGYGLKKVADPFVFEAPDYDTLADAPGIVSPTLDVVTFEHNGSKYHLAFQGPIEYPMEKIVENTRKIVAEAVKMFGDKAPFDDYWFVYHSIPGGRYHGVEHLNSTSITFPAATFDDAAALNRYYSLSSHEFFHVWNVKRIRPQALGPFDYSREVFTRNLWVAEGITSYYDDLLCKRAGVYSQKDYLTALSNSINGQQRTPGRKITSVAQASFDGWLTPDDSRNVVTDFYTKGSLIGLMLDMDIRRKTNNAKTLDDVMRYLNDTYAKKGVGYPENGVQMAVETITGADYKDFFNRYVYGLDELPYADYLTVVGLELVEVRTPGKPAATLGVELSGDEKQTILSNVIPGEAAFKAGLDKGDILVAIDGEQANTATLPRLMRNRKPGETVKVHVLRRGKLREFPVTLQDGGNLELQVRPLKDMPEPAKTVFRSWVNEN
jgi:predicted metalloprotease with PDZ domain